MPCPPSGKYPKKRFSRDYRRRQGIMSPKLIDGQSPRLDFTPGPFYISREVNKVAFLFVAGRARPGEGYRP